MQKIFELLLLKEMIFFNTPMQNKNSFTFGQMEGFVEYLSEDFDAPLTDFNDYM